MNEMKLVQSVRGRERDSWREATKPKMRPPHLVRLASCFFFPVLLLALAAATATASPSAAADFVRRSCRSTEYPRVCESTLVPRASGVGRSPRRLARAALLVGADRARNCSAFIIILHVSNTTGGGAAMKDCAELARDAEERLRESAAELAKPMDRAGSPRFAWALGNAQTWASAALTDTSTCIDSLAVAGQQQQQQKKKDGEVVGRVKRRVVAVSQATSNALALVNRLQPPAATHKHRQRQRLRLL